MYDKENLIGSNITNELDALSVEQFALEAKFYFAQMGQNAIEFGKRLIAIKKKLPPSEWINWLKDNFQLKKSSAENFMKIAERFSNFQSIGNLGYTQMLALVSLRERDEWKFLDDMEAQGTPVEKKTKRQANATVKDWKATSKLSKSNITI